MDTISSAPIASIEPRRETLYERTLRAAMVSTEEWMRCARKVKHETIESATASMERKASGRADVYACQHCGHFHWGHRR